MCVGMARGLLTPVSCFYTSSFLQAKMPPGRQRPLSTAALAFIKQACPWAIPMVAMMHVMMSVSMWLAALFVVRTIVDGNALPYLRDTTNGLRKKAVMDVQLASNLSTEGARDALLAVRSMECPSARNNASTMFYAKDAFEKVEGNDKMVKLKPAEPREDDSSSLVPQALEGEEHPAVAAECHAVVAAVAVAVAAALLLALRLDVDGDGQPALRALVTHQHSTQTPPWRLIGDELELRAAAAEASLCAPWPPLRETTLLMPSRVWFS